MTSLPRLLVALVALVALAPALGCGARSSLYAPDPGAGGASASVSASASSGVGVNVGCSDGTREGFSDVVKYPGIAGCSGGFLVPGVLVTLAPVCGRNAGNSSSNPDGFGCSVADLCSQGYHVCTSEGDVAAHSSTGCDGAANAPGLFFATRQSGTGCAICSLGASVSPATCTGCSCATDCAQSTLTANDLFGCGSLGEAPSSCGILDRTSNNLCSALGSPWACGGDGCREAHAVIKITSAGGGVLCCAD